MHQETQSVAKELCNKPRMHHEHRLKPVHWVMAKAHHLDQNYNPEIPVLLPARRYASAGLCDSDVSVCLSGRLSHAGIVPSRAKAGS